MAAVNLCFAAPDHDCAAQATSANITWECSHLQEGKAGKGLQGTSDSARVTLMGTTDPGEWPDPPERSPVDSLQSLQSKGDASI